jgi:hypothetical protein
LKGEVLKRETAAVVAGPFMANREQGVKIISGIQGDKGGVRRFRQDSKLPVILRDKGR